MRIHADFIGGNIKVLKIDGSEIYVQNELRDTTEDWFYWAFCVEDAAGQTLTFHFDKRWLGYYGPAVSRDLKNWRWLGSSDETKASDTFTYTFADDEQKVYFAHNMLYHPAHFEEFCKDNGLTAQTLCISEKGREVPYITFGSGDEAILMTARHHACESTGTYVLEGVVKELLREPIPGLKFIAVPFVDYDGVVDGDQGKNRKPHDHNRDYTDAPIYGVIREMIAFGKENDLRYTFDFHSPWHMGAENDYVFFSRSTEAMEPFTNAFGEYMKRETADNELKYTGNWDVGPNEKWNDETSPNSKNYFSKMDSVRLSVTTETPYFGVTDGMGKISQEAMLELGRAFGRSIAAYIKDNNRYVR